MLDGSGFWFEARTGEGFCGFMMVSGGEADSDGGAQIRWRELEVGVFSRVPCSVDRRRKRPRDGNSDAARFVGERSLIAFLVSDVAHSGSDAETAGCSGPKGHRP
ncbi:hypothetical protein S245_029680 [Arachis hypogaea]